MNFKKLLEIIEDMNEAEKEQEVVVLLDDEYHIITTSFICNEADVDAYVKQGQMVLV